MRPFRLFGIQLTASWSWLLMLGLLVYVARATLAALLPGMPPLLLTGLAAVATLLAVISLYAHELAHALVARHFGIPVRSISLFFLGGLAHIARESPTPRVEFLIAVAGPATTLTIGLVGLLLGLASGALAPVVGALGLWLALVNLPLGVFNLVPAYPLDGGRVFRAVLWFASQDHLWGSLIAARAGQLAAVALLLSGLASVFAGGPAGLSGVWLVFVGAFLYIGALSTHRATVLRDHLRELSASAVMQRNFGRVAADETLQTFAESALTPAGASRPPPTYGVYRDEQIVGLLRTSDLRRVPRDRWNRIAVERVMVPFEQVPHVEPTWPAGRVLHLLLEEGEEQVAVVSDGRLLGVITRLDLARAAERARQASQ